MKIIHAIYEGMMGFLLCLLTGFSLLEICFPVAEIEHQLLFCWIGYGLVSGLAQAVFALEKKVLHS